MAVQKITIEDTCTSCSLCEQICPEVFEIQAVAQVKQGADLNKFEAKIKEAAESCPVQAIIVE